MNEQKQPPFMLDLESDSNYIIQLSEGNSIKQNINHRYLSLGELLRANPQIRNLLMNEKENWFYAGIECLLMIPGENWQQGRLKLRLDFIPDVLEENAEPQPELQESDTSPLDDIRQSLLNESQS